MEFKAFQFEISSFLLNVILEASPFTPLRKLSASAKKANISLTHRDINLATVQHSRILPGNTVWFCKMVIFINEYSLERLQ